MNEKNNLVIKDDKLNKAYGVLICLFAIYLSLNLAKVWIYDILIYPARAITWFLSFFFGSVFTYVIYFLLFVSGLYLIFKKDKNTFVSKDKKMSSLYIIGIILLFIGGGIVICNAMCKGFSDNQTTYLTFSNFGSILVNNVIKTQEGLVIYFDKNPGIISMILTASFNTFMNPVLTYVFGSIILTIGIILILVKPLIYLHHLAKDYSNFNHLIDPDTKYTKARDITITTTTINSLDNDDSDLDIVAERVNSKPFEKVSSKDIMDDYQDDYVPNQKEEVFSKDHFEDKPMQKAKYVDESSSIVIGAAATNSIFESKENDYYEEETPKKEEKSVSYSSVNQNPSEKYRTRTTRVDIAYDLNNPEPPKVVSKSEPISNKRPKNDKMYVAPSINLLEDRRSEDAEVKNEQLAQERTQILNETLKDLNVKAMIVSHKIGPSITRYDIQTAKNESIRGFDNKLDDLSIRLGGITNIRFSPVVRGKTTSGLEIPNAETTMVNFKDCLVALNKLPKTKSTSIVFGKDINNEALICDLQEMPHLLVSGTTGSGKSIFIHSLIMTLIMRNSPKQLKLLLVDPKNVEFTKYREIPHLLCPVITLENPDTPYEVLKKVCDIMDERYKMFSKCDCSKLKEYNEWARNNGKEELPIIVIVIDEYADMIDTNKKISEPVVRIGQKARAAGIHMIVATQRPSVNVINGVIKANIPSRVALLSSSYVDSNTILDSGGAEKLIGNGDMLIKCAVLDNTGLLRCQGSFVSNGEIKAVCDYLRANYNPDYDDEIVDIINKPIAEEPALVQQAKESRYGNEEEMYTEIKNYTMSEDYISISKLQSTFGLGFARASRFFKRLQSEGVVSSDAEKNSAKGSKVLIHNFDRTIKESGETLGSIEQTTFVKK